ncbi:hypothetical protein BJX62DRAFT_208908 [Aspergillus germanicus]
MCLAMSASDVWEWAALPPWFILFVGCPCAVRGQFAVKSTERRMMYPTESNLSDK